MSNPKAQFQINNGAGWETVAETDIIDGVAHAPNAWTMARVMQKRICYTGSLPVEVTIAPSNPRNTHFLGFAKLLVDELKVTGGYPISEVKQLIARRAYDLVKHTILNIGHANLDMLTTEECAQRISDLPELPKDGEL